MSEKGIDISALNAAQKRDYLKQLVRSRASNAAESLRSGRKRIAASAKGEKSVPEKHYKFEKIPEYKALRNMMDTGSKLRIANPYYRTFDGVAGATTMYEGREYLNYTNYNYLGMCGDPKVSAASAEAIKRYGTSASASRIVAGQRPIHTELEKEISDTLGVDDAIVFTSGFGTNMSAIGSLFGQKDLIIHDELSHNSVLQGAILSGARRIPFDHNDWQALEDVLRENRHDYEKVVIILEGQYGMDGDLADPRKAIALKKRFKTFLMIDEAHSMGVAGKRGFGVIEEFGVDPGDVDILMGTLSKSFAACGGYIAGGKALVEYLRYSCPGAVYSAGMSPPVAAAALQAIRLMKEEPERVARLRANTKLFLTLARERGLDTGLSMGVSIVPVIIGSSVISVLISNNLLERGINVLPILHPAVPERETRLRFFLSCDHTEEQIRATVDAVAEESEKLRRH